MRNVGVQAGVAAAVLFGAGTPVVKLLLGEVSPWLLAGLLSSARASASVSTDSSGARLAWSFSGTS